MRSKGKEKESHKNKQKPKASEESGKDATTKAKFRVEKLRRQLEKEERRIAEAEAHDANPLSKSKATYNPTKDVEKTEQRPANMLKSQRQGVVEPLTPTSKPSTPSSSPQQPHRNVYLAHKNVKQKTSRGATSPDPGALLSNSTSSLSTMDSDDLTSSSGSSLSDVDSSETEAPEEMPVIRPRPNENISQMQPQVKGKICHAYLNRGRCKLGPKCRYRHELPARSTRAQKAKTKARNGNDAKLEGRRERVSLYQRVSVHSVHTCLPDS